MMNLTFSATPHRGGANNTSGSAQQRFTPDASASLIPLHNRHTEDTVQLSKKQPVHFSAQSPAQSRSSAIAAINDFRHETVKAMFQQMVNQPNYLVNNPLAPNINESNFFINHHVALSKAIKTFAAANKNCTYEQAVEKIRDLARTHSNTNG
jgi:hypothetical protein